MDSPGEFFAPIGAGPFRGIPAIHLVDVDGKALEENIPKLVDDAVATFGLGYVGKPFLYIARSLDPKIIEGMRMIGMYTIADVGPHDNKEWIGQCNHIMVGWNLPTTGERMDSFVYAPDPDLFIKEPKFQPRMRTVPKFLLVPRLTKEVMAFLANTEYPWSLQLNGSLPFKIPLSRMYEEEEDK